MVTTAPRAAVRDGGGGRPCGDEGRPVLRRKGLPSGRAVTGALLVAVAAVGVFAAIQNANKGPSTEYVVVRDAVPLGERLTADERRVAQDRAAAVVGRRGRFTGIDQVVGDVTIAPLAAGELVQRSSVVRRRVERRVPGAVAPPGGRAPVDTRRRRPGQRAVDLLATVAVTRSRSSSTRSSWTSAAATGAASRASGKRTITLALQTARRRARRDPRAPSRGSDARARDAGAPRASRPAGGVRRARRGPPATTTSTTTGRAGSGARRAVRRARPGPRPLRLVPRRRAGGRRRPPSPSSS